MSLSPNQLTILTTFVNGTTNPEIVAAREAGATYDLMVLLNEDVDPPTKGWRLIPTSDVAKALAPVELDNLFQNGGSKGFAIDFSMKWLGGIDCSTPNGPKAITDIVTQAAAPTSRAALINAATEDISLAEQVIGGTSATSVSPPAAQTALIRNFVGDVTQEECQEILKSPPE